MKILLTILIITLVLASFACSAAPSASAIPTATTEATQSASPTSLAAESAAPTASDARPILKTAAGDFEIASAHLVDEIKGEKPGPGEKILVLLLTQPGGAQLDPATFSLEAFDRAQHDTSKGEVHLEGEDGSYSLGTMAGWVGEKYDQFVIGFRVPVAAQTFRLFWPGNEAIDIGPIEIGLIQ